MKKTNQYLVIDFKELLKHLNMVVVCVKSHSLLTLHKKRGAREGLGTLYKKKGAREGLRTLYKKGRAREGLGTKVSIFVKLRLVP